MKVAVVRSYGDHTVFSVEVKPMPHVQSHDVLIRIEASAVHAADARIRQADPAVIKLVYGWKRPRYTLGVVVAGEIVAVGEKVQGFQVGQRVFGMTGFSMGGYAEYLCLTDKASLAVIPQGVSYEEAATIPFGATTAKYFLNKATIKSGLSVLVIGAGAVGTAAAQLAHSCGARVTVVAHPAIQDWLQHRGVHQVYDYTKTPLFPILEKFDVVFDTVNKTYTPIQKELLNSTEGKYILINAGFGTIARSVCIKELVTGVVHDTSADMVEIAQMVEKESLVPLIDSVFPLSRIGEAHQRYEDGGCSGVVVVSPMNT